MDRERLEQELRGYFKAEIKRVEPSPEWWNNAISQVGEPKPRSSPEKPAFWKFRPSLIAIPLSIFLLVALVSLLVLHPWSTSPGPGEVMAKASAATMELQSYRMTGFTMTTFEEETSKTTFEMEFVTPDRYHGKITRNEKLYEYIIIGNKQYSRELGSDQSVHIVAIVGYSSTLTIEQTLEFLRLLNDLEELPDEKIEGIDCLHYKGEVNMDRMVEEQIARLDPAQPGYEEWVKSLEQQLLNIKMELELWIGKDDYLIRQLKHDMYSSSEGAEQTEWTTSSLVEKYYDFNELIAIESPETASGELAPGWHLVDSYSPGFEFEEPSYPSKTPPN